MMPRVADDFSCTNSISRSAYIIPRLPRNYNPGIFPKLLEILFQLNLRRVVAVHQSNTFRGWFQLPGKIHQSRMVRVRGVSWQGSDGGSDWGCLSSDVNDSLCCVFLSSCALNGFSECSPGLVSKEKYIMSGGWRVWLKEDGVSKTWVGPSVLF